MSFLNSAILAGLAAALGPLLIHLLNRRRVRTVEFSSVMFLRDLRRTRMRRLQLRRWLLLVIRTLIVALAVLAFARPALKGGVFAALGSRARTTAVVALDRSASMAQETVNGSAYERGQKRAREIAGLVGEGDHVIGLPFSGPSAPEADPPTADVSRLVKHLAELPVSFGSTDAGLALSEALRAAGAGGNLNREIYLIGDMRREGFTKTVVPPADADLANVTVYIVDVGGEKGYDLGVSEIKVGDQLISVGLPFDLTATVVNNSDQPVEQLLVSLFVDGRRVAQREASLDAHGTASIPFTAMVETGGMHSGFMEISADDNPLNNRRYFAVSIPDQIRILLSSDYPSARTAARLALASQPESARRFLITEIDSDDLLRQNLFDYDCVVVTEWRKPDAAAVDQIVRFVRGGGGVFVAPSADADTTAWNNLIARPHFGLSLGPNPAAPSPERYFIWDRFTWDHPVWAVYRQVPRDKIPEIRWYSIFKVSGNSLGRPVVDFSGGWPSWTEVRESSGKIIASWAPPNAPYTDLPLHSLFVPLMHRLVEHLAADLSERRGDYLAGEPIVREPSRAIAANADLQLAGPEGTLLRPTLDWAGGQVKAKIGTIERPGVYTLIADDKPIDVFSVNIDPRETAPERIGHDELARRWPGYKLVFVDGDEPLAQLVKQTRYGTEIRSTFLWAVMGLFLLEMFIARTRRKDIPVESDTAATQLQKRSPAIG
jgi:hypothetical protein